MTEPEPGNWRVEFNRIQEAVECARSRLSGLVHWLYENVVGHDVLPRQLPREVEPLIGQLHDALANADQATRHLANRLCGDPAAKLLRGMRLSREEYYILMARGAMPWTASALCLDTFDDYEVSVLLHYEDDVRYGYIDPGLPPPDPPQEVGVTYYIRPRFGVTPENVRVRFLTPEQREFFQRHFPQVYARFRGDGEATQRDPADDRT